MTDYTELKRLAEAFPSDLDWDSNTEPFFNGPSGESLGGGATGFYSVYGKPFRLEGEDYDYDGPTYVEACPADFAKFMVAARAGVLALIAENERLQHREQDLSASVKYWFNACGGKQFEAGVKHADEAASKYIDEHWRQQRDRLRAEIAGLKTGYEAYERVNAELKAELAAEIQRRFDGNEIAARERDEEVRKLKAENEALRKDAERFRYWRRCWANEEDANLPYSVEMQMDSNGDFEIEDAFDAAMGKGEQS